MKPEKSTYRSAAFRILADERKPMHYKEITKRALERGLIKPAKTAKTPHCTMISTIRNNMDRLGKESPFLEHGDGIYGLNKRHLRIATNLTGTAGELSVAYELLWRGCTVFQPAVDNIGIDIISLQGGKTAYIQVKTATKKENGNYVVTIKKNAYNKAERYGTAYVLVLQDGRETAFAILLAREIEKIFVRRKCRRSTDHTLTLTKEGAKIFLSTGKKQSDRMEVPDNWDKIIKR